MGKIQSKVKEPYIFLTEYYVCFAVLQLLPLLLCKPILKSHMEGCQGRGQQLHKRWTSSLCMAGVSSELTNKEPGSTAAMPRPDQARKWSGTQWHSQVVRQLEVKLGSLFSGSGSRWGLGGHIYWHSCEEAQQGSALKPHPKSSSWGEEGQLLRA